MTVTGKIRKVQTLGGRSRVLVSTVCDALKERTAIEVSARASWMKGRRKRRGKDDCG